MGDIFTLLWSNVSYDCFTKVRSKEIILTLRCIINISWWSCFILYWSDYLWNIYFFQVPLFKRNKLCVKLCVIFFGEENHQIMSFEEQIKGDREDIQQLRWKEM